MTNCLCKNANHLFLPIACIYTKSSKSSIVPRVVVCSVGGGLVGNSESPPGNSGVSGNRPTSG